MIWESFKYSYLIVHKITALIADAELDAEEKMWGRLKSWKLALR